MKIHTFRKSGAAICLGSIKDGSNILAKTSQLISFIKSRSDFEGTTAPWLPMCIFVLVLLCIGV